MTKKTSGFHTTPLSVTSIQLDPENPRLPRKNGEYSQPEIISELLAHEEIDKIAKSITETGYFSLDNIVCFKDTDGKTYVLEGNRRICACKLILNPKSAPPQYQKKYEAFAKNFDLESIKKLPVVLVDSRVDAYPMMVSKHTKSLTKDWEPIMQAQFYLSVLDKGYTIQEASVLLKVTPGDIKSAISLLDLYSAAKQMNADEKTKEAISDVHNFELSTLKRVFTNKNVKEALGIETNNDGKISVGIKQEQFKKVFEKIVSDIATGEKDSRSLNKTSDIEQYMTDLKSEGYLPKTPTKSADTKLGEIFKKEEAVEAAPQIVEDAKPAIKKTSSTIKRIGIVTSDVKCTHVDKIGDVFKELKRLPPDKVPNSCAMTLRMLLELSTYQFLKDSGEYDKHIRKLAGTGDPKKVPPLELKVMLELIVSEKLLNDTQLTKALKAFIDGKSTNPILNTLNQFVHNVHWKATDDKLAHIWDDLKEYFKIVLIK